MNDLIHVDLTDQERSILLKGLRYVRSSIMLETHEPTKEHTQYRSGQLDEIQMLSQRLEASDPVGSQV